LSEEFLIAGYDFDYFREVQLSLGNPFNYKDFPAKLMLHVGQTGSATGSFPARRLQPVPVSEAIRSSTFWGYQDFASQEKASLYLDSLALNLRNRASDFEKDVFGKTNPDLKFSLLVSSELRRRYSEDRIRERSITIGLLPYLIRSD